MSECRSQPVNVKLWFLLVPYYTSIMLIVNIILFTFGICFATNVVSPTRASVTSAATSTKLKRLVVDPGHNIRNNQEQSKGTQTTPRISSPQDINLRSSPRYGNAKATDPQRVSYTRTNHGSGSHAYGTVPKRPLSYVSSPVHQIKSEQKQSNLLAPYFDILNNPDVYKTTRSVEKPLDTSKSIVSQSLQKLQDVYSPSYNAFYQNKPIELSSFSDFEYPSYSSVNKLISQGVQNGASSSTVQAPVYKTSYSVPKVTNYAHVYEPSIPTVSSITPSSDKTTQNSKQKDEATVDVNGKKISVPIIQLQSNLDFSGVLPAFDSQPFLLSANYPIESDVGFKFGIGPKFNMALQSSNVSPFSSPLSSFQGQVVPIQTANGSPQFPLYKGASIEAYPVASNVPKAQGNYESLYNQPQLHFDKERAVNGNIQPINVQQNTVHPSVSTQGILNDVEIINKKHPEPHAPQPDKDDEDEEREDERYKSPDKEYDHSFEDDEDEQPQSRKYFKAPPKESDFKPSTVYPFKEYDERFGKHRAQSDDDDFEDKPYSSYKNYSDDDEEEEDPSSEYRAEYTESSKPSQDSYEEEDEEEEEESRKQEKRKEANESSYEVEEPKRSKYYQKDFEQEFEDSYKEELPKQEYVHVKEVPEIDSYISPSPKRQKNNNQSRVRHEQPKESRSEESRISRKNHKIPKIDYRDSTAFGSDVFVKRTPKVIHEEFFEYKNPGAKKYSKYVKTEKVSPTKKSPKEDDYAAKYHKFKTGSGLTPKDKDPYFSASNRKLNKTSPEKTITNVRQLSELLVGTSFYGPNVLNGQMRSLTNAEILRDLTGI